MATLYRKYRPAVFSDVVGQEYILTTIMNQLKTGHVAQAYLFCGPRGTGKTTLARLLAKAVNCQKRAAGQAEPCGKCQSCLDITALRHIDVMEIDAASQTGVDNVRENIIENTRFKPSLAPYKVFIVDEVHMLSTSSFNALLKTLEEPPEHVIFILATTEAHKLPATVVSRCQRFTFQRIPFSLIKERLATISQQEQLSVSPDTLNQIALKSEGGLRDAENLLGQIAALGGAELTPAELAAILPPAPTAEALTFVEFLAKRNAAGAITAVNELAARGINPDYLARELTMVARHLLYIKILSKLPEAEAVGYNSELLDRLTALATQFAETELIRLLDLILKRRGQIKTAPLPQLPVELLAVEFLFPNENASPPPALPPVAPNAPAVTPPSVVQAALPQPLPAAPAIVLAAPETIKNASVIKTALKSLKRQQLPNTTLEAIQAKWDEIVMMISKSSHSLTFILKMCTPVTIDENGLHLSLPYAFHKEKLEEHKNRRLLEETLEHFFQEKISLVCKTTPVHQPAGETQPAPANLAALATEFGGELMA